MVVTPHDFAAGHLLAGATVAASRPSTVCSMGGTCAAGSMARWVSLRMRWLCGGTRDQPGSKRIER